MNYSSTFDVGESHLTNPIGNVLLRKAAAFIYCCCGPSCFCADSTICADSWCALTAALRSPLAADEADIPREFSREQLRGGVPFRSVLEDVADSGLLGVGSPGRASVFYEDFPAAAMLFKGLRKAARKPMFMPWIDRRRNVTTISHAVSSSGAAYKLGSVGSGPILLLAEPKYFNEYVAPASHHGESRLTDASTQPLS